MSDSNNQFHYFRLTADDRILWGGYDAVYYFGNGVGPEYDRRPATTDKLERQFRAAFPQLGSLAFPYRWGGAIDTTTRFTVTFGQALGGRLTYALGYTGLGVGASRWAAGVVRDFILRPDSLPLLQAALRPDAADPVSAGAAPVRGGQHRPLRARPGRPQRGQARPAARGPRRSLGDRRLRLAIRIGPSGREAERRAASLDTSRSHGPQSRR